MAHLLAERKPFLLLLVLLTLNLVLMSSQVRGAGRGSLLEDAILNLCSPFLKSASWVSQGAAATWKSYAGLRGVERENRRLHEEVATLALKAQQVEETRQELDRLRGLLDFRSRVEYRSVPARVLASGAFGAGMTLLLDRGGHEGVERNHPVLTPRGVVGRVIRVEPGISKVQTILDPNSGVAVLIQRTRVQGILVGLAERGCRMEYVSELSNVEVGDVVVTSGLDQIYPKGLLVGVVTAIGEGEGLTRIVDVRPEVDFSRLEEALILLKPEGPPERESR
ncbi:MAG TPA: rod shape-determining protein MreC [Candidatus Polarisedimenticolia bacterium]|nr:rod shape-determining protein MreC [Candidatus Polarisedimenticolia bacterium]